MLILFSDTLRTTDLVLVSGLIVGLAVSQPAAAQSETSPERPATFTYPEVQSKARASDPAVTGSAKAAETRSSSARVSQGRQIGGGRATFYQHPGRTASGEPFNPNGLTAAHHSLPFGSKVRVVNKSNGRSVVVRITDRTNQKTNAKRPYAIDLSRGSARAIGIASVGQVALYQAD